jgi:MerR family transcriptional regulator, thiopeptide resistance regulator
MHVSTTRPGLRIGAVAKATGLTVRTLHHYDAIGLLRPTERSEAGYRLYDEADLRRLYRIIAMRGMGFPLETIGRALDHRREDPRPAVRDHLRQVEEQLRLAAQLQAKLTGVLDALDRSDQPSGDLFMEIIEVMTKMQRHYTPVQLEPLVERWNALIEAFTGGDPGTRASLQRMYEENDPHEISRGAMSAETMAYAQRALQAYAR